jgi:arginase
MLSLLKSPSQYRTEDNFLWKVASSQRPRFWLKTKLLCRSSGRRSPTGSSLLEVTVPFHSPHSPYLASRYAGDVAVLWVDAHFDLTTSEVSTHAHGYPMLNLLGKGDAEFAAFAKDPIPTKRLAYVGIDKGTISERSRRAVEELKPTVFAPSELTQNFSEVTDWIKATGASKLVVHFDLDVLDPKKFREQLFNNPAGLAEQFKASPTGQMDFDTVVALLNKCAEVIDIVGLTIAEHLPWDAENLRAALAKLPILSD